MPRIVAEGKKLTNVSLAGQAAAASAVGGPVDPNVQRKFALDPSELSNDAALECINQSQQAPVEPVVQTTAPVIGGVGAGQVGQDVVEQSALLVSLNDKLDQLLKKRGLEHDDSDDEEGDVEEVEQQQEQVGEGQVAADSIAGKVAKQKVTHASKKQKTAQILTEKLSQSASQAGGVQVISTVASELIAKVNSKLDTLIEDITDSECSTSGDESTSDEDSTEEEGDQEEVVDDEEQDQEDADEVAEEEEQVPKQQKGKKARVSKVKATTTKVAHEE